MPLELTIGLSVIIAALLIYLFGYLRGKTKGIDIGLHLTAKYLAVKEKNERIST